jgi:hypothetical protein
MRPYDRSNLSGFRSPFASRRPGQPGRHAVLPLRKQEGRPCGRPFIISDTLYSELDIPTYWQASQVPPLRMASMEQAFFSSAVYSFFSALGAFSTVAFSMLEAPRVRR